MQNMSPENGAINLLRNCADARPGERLLIAYEAPEYGYFDAASVGVVTRAAQSIGLKVDTLDVGFDPDTPQLSPALRERFNTADIVVFLARLGDQLRFSEMPAGKRVVVSFALSEHQFGSGFANGHHAAFLALKDAVNRVFHGAGRVRITCPRGTEITGRPQMNMTSAGDTSVRRFPMSVFTPVPAHSFSGRVALGFLTGTGSRYYDGYSTEFDAPVFARLDQGRLTGFEGQARDVARANAQYDRVAARFGIDRDFVHSWHAGIHPGCGFPWDMRRNWERWGGAAFGNPRILHFHTCGAYAPGEISWNVIDPTIEVDGLILWDRGAFMARRLPGGPEILAQYPCAEALFQQPDTDIGLREAG
ncbi:hypothetical protein AB9K34_05460 [Sedimentitalea sp. XS_ASV28]|uniref:hypothetical protein n=1 Tax=Sedimentitalea sp. XS_ASV28 TaxID=3241296 RepID=UPI003518C7BF